MNVVPAEQKNDSRIQSLAKEMERQLYDNSHSKVNLFLIHF